MAKTIMSKERQADIRAHNDKLEETSAKELNNLKKLARIDDEVGGKAINLKNYDEFSLFNYSLKYVLDDVILVEYVDESEEGIIQRGGIFIATSMMDKNKSPWRIGKVLLAGPNCQTIKQGDTVCFPGDKGLKASNISVVGYGKIKKALFLNESRVFGGVQADEQT